MNADMYVSLTVAEIVRHIPVSFFPGPKDASRKGAVFEAQRFNAPHVADGIAVFPFGNR